MRLIATEEAFAPSEYIDEYLKLTQHVDTAVTRYLAIYYKKAEAVRQLTDLDYRIAEMDQFKVDMHLLSITSPGVQAFDATLGTELAVIANDKLAAAVAKASGASPGGGVPGLGNARIATSAGGVRLAVNRPKNAAGTGGGAGTTSGGPTAPSAGRGGAGGVRTRLGAGS